MNERKVIAADYHRNGIAGEGFFVGIVEEDGRRMLVITFPDQRDVCTAVLDLDKAAAGNIYMFPVPGQPGTGWNAWRGDLYADLLDDLRAAYRELLA